MPSEPHHSFLLSIAIIKQLLCTTSLAVGLVIDSLWSLQIFEDHWRPEAIEIGLKSGSLIQGQIRVSKHHPGLEAFVVRGNK